MDSILIILVIPVIGLAVAWTFGFLIACAIGPFEKRRIRLYQKSDHDHFRLVKGLNGDETTREYGIGGGEEPAHTIVKDAVYQHAMGGIYQVQYDGYVVDGGRAYLFVASGTILRIPLNGFIVFSDTLQGVVSSVTDQGAYEYDHSGLSHCYQFIEYGIESLLKAHFAVVDERGGTQGLITNGDWVNQFRVRRYEALIERGIFIRSGGDPDLVRLSIYGTLLVASYNATAMVKAFVPVAIRQKLFIRNANAK